MTPAGLGAELGVSRATVYRDIGTLEQAGVPIVIEHINGEARYSLSLDELPSLVPTSRQLAALRLARDVLAPLKGTSIIAELDRLLEFPSKAPARPIVKARRSENANAKVLQTIEVAVHRARRLRILHRGAAASTATFREVDPVALRLVDEHLYLVAWAGDRKAWRTFKISRVSDAMVLDEPAEPHPDFDEGALFDGAVRIWSADPVDVAVRLSAEVGWLVRDWPLHGKQRLETQPDGSTVVRARVNGIVEPLRWVLRWGPEAEALEPVELRDAVAAATAAAAGLYRKNVGPRRVVSAIVRQGTRKVGARVAGESPVR